MNRKTDTLSHVHRVAISRRQLLAKAAMLASSVAASTSVASAFHSADSGRVQLRLPAPTGPSVIGTVSLHLVDIDRRDPWLGMKPRELMVSVWYPAQHTRGWRLAPWISPAALAAYREFEAIKLEASLDGVEYPITHGRESAPVLRPERRYPVVLYSPSGAGVRALGTTQVEDLVSHGYVVVTIDHTYNAIAVEFPRGRVELNPTPPTRPGPPPEGALPIHIQVAVHRNDVRFVLDSVAMIARGENPDAERRLLPAGLRGSLDMGRVGMFGHSFGGCTTAHAMAADPRIIAGINLDGSVVADVPMSPGGGPGQSKEHLAAIAKGIDTRPFMFMSSGGRGPDQLGPLVADFWYSLPGWRRFLTLIGSTHGSYVDDLTLYNQLAAAGIISARGVGRIDPERGLAAQRTYIRAFFDLWLRRRHTSLLDGPAPDYPEVAFMAF